MQRMRRRPRFKRLQLLSLMAFGILLSPQGQQRDILHPMRLAGGNLNATREADQFISRLSELQPRGTCASG